MHTGRVGGFKDNGQTQVPPAKDFHLVDSGVPGGPLAVHSGRPCSVKWGGGRLTLRLTLVTQLPRPAPDLWGQASVICSHSAPPGVLKTCPPLVCSPAHVFEGDLFSQRMRLSNSIVKPRKDGFPFREIRG